LVFIEEALLNSTVMDKDMELSLLFLEPFGNQTTELG